MVDSMLSQDTVMVILFFQLKKQMVNGIGVLMPGVEKVKKKANFKQHMEFTVFKEVFM